MILVNYNIKLLKVSTHYKDIFLCDPIYLVSSKSLYDWVKRFGGEPDTGAEDAAEIKRLKAELRRVTEERDILKKATAYFAKDHG